MQKTYIRHFRVNAVVILDFFQNLLGSNVYSWFTKLLQISQIIVSSLYLMVLNI